VRFVNVHISGQAVFLRIAVMILAQQEPRSTGERPTGVMVLFCKMGLRAYFLLRRFRRSRRFLEPIFLRRRGLGIMLLCLVRTTAG
jgi:hypothetical protein